MIGLQDLPDSPLATSARELAVGVEPSWLVNHSVRTFFLGGQLLEAAGKQFDQELLYVGSMLHDIALGTDLDDGTTPFHLRGAGLAARHVIEAGRSDVDASLIYDAIALHMEVATADESRYEVAGVHLGAAADVVGLRVDQIPGEWLEVLLDVHPREQMKESITHVFAEESRRKPYSTAATLVHDLNFLDLIDAAPFNA